ncbi:MAG: MarR family transcriptional regulator [Clostridiaceae bacterium]|nr:MarR family transcriptional regulator [Clostridiaceae bacterium]
MLEKQLLLDNQLCFPLYAASRKIIRLYTPLLAPLGITYTQYITLMALWEKDGLAVKTLGEMLFLDSGTLTPLIKKLEAQGIVRRERDKNDERNVSVFLTDAGIAIKEDALRIPEQIASCVPLSSEEAAALYNMLHKILKTDFN